MGRAHIFPTIYPSKDSVNKRGFNMSKVKTKSEQEFDRTEILRYLNECGLQPVTPKSILIYGVTG